MKTGVVKWWNRDKGFGFIAPDGGGDDIFVHHTGIAGGKGRKDLDEGDEVEFGEAPGQEGKGPKAAAVRVLRHAA